MGSFKPSSTFEGHRPGFIFTAGGLGLGYYPDTKSAVTRYSAGEGGFLFGACSYGDVKTMDMLADQNQGQPDYLTQTSAEGLTLTHAAARDGAVESIRWLAAHNVLSHNEAANEGLFRQCPLHLVADNKGANDNHDNLYCKGLGEIAQLLLDNGAVVDCRDTRCRTPLSLAAEFGRTGLVTLLVRSGADVSAADHENDSVLHWAAFGGNLEVLTVLLTQGASLSVTDLLGQTALHVAANRGHTLSAEALLDASFSSISTNAFDEDRFINPPELMEKDLQEHTPADLAGAKLHYHTARTLNPVVCRANWLRAVPGTKRELQLPFVALIGHLVFSWWVAYPHLLACTAVTTSSVAWLLLPLGLGAQLLLLLALGAAIYGDPGIVTPTKAMHQVLTLCFCPCCA
jgi:ankyrin repeat protein